VAAFANRAHFPVIVLGTGIAGLTAAFCLASAGIKVLLVTKTADPKDCNTFWAQGGIIYEGENDSPAKLIETLNAIGGRHGVGRADLVENRLIGIKSRGVYETPGGTLLVNALKALESITLDRDSAHEKERISTRYAELVYFGQWFSPLKEAFDAFVDTLMENVSGTVTLKLYKGGCAVVSRTSPYSLYSEDLASFNMRGYDAADSAGFIRLFGLPLRGRKRIGPIDVKKVAP